MKLTADYHTHTIFSHGAGTVDDNVKAAMACGLTTVGIADHSIAHYAYGVKRRRVAKYLEAIGDARRKYAEHIDVRAGIELNLTGLDGSVDMPDGAFDVTILGFHKAVFFRGVKTAWRLYTGYTRFGRPNEITQAYMRAIQKYHIDIVAHPGYGTPVDFAMLGQACADYGTRFEINEKHTELTADALRQAADTGVQFVISSDAHDPRDVGKTPRALALAEQAGLDIARIDNAVEG